uniref:J domain-containing protein n=1 Tax=Romanomermis culicivorax TaxID=13658 RepID=A0A915ICA1_ROMCU
MIVTIPAIEIILANLMTAMMTAMIIATPRVPHCRTIAIITAIDQSQFFLHSTNGRDYFFKEDIVYQATPNGLVQSPVKSYFPKFDGSVDAAVTTTVTQLTLLFRGNKVFAYEWDNRDQKFDLHPDFPKNLPADVPFNPEWAFRWTDGNTVLVKGPDFVIYDENYNKPTMVNKMKIYFSDIPPDSIGLFSIKDDIMIVDKNSRVPQTASNIEIRLAYIELCKKFHPDCAQYSSDQQFIEINEAYNVLSKSDLRKQYDSKLKQPVSYADNKTQQHSTSSSGYEYTRQEAPYSFKWNSSKNAKTLIQLLIMTFVITNAGFYIERLFNKRRRRMEMFDYTKEEIEERRSTKKNYYEILGVSKNATKQEIKSAFVTLSKKWLMVYLQILYPGFATKIGSHSKHDLLLRMKSSGIEVASPGTELHLVEPVRQYHPDVKSASTSKDQNSHEKFVEINEAYSVLSKEESRREYDRGLNDFQRPSPDTFYQPPPRYPPSPPYSSFGGPYRDRWKNEFWQEYFRQREKTSPLNGFSPEDRRNAERNFWFFIFTFIFLSTMMNLMLREKFPANNRDFVGPFHGRHVDTARPQYERELQDEQTRRQVLLISVICLRLLPKKLIERYKEEEKIRAKMYKEEQEKRRRQDEESQKLRPHPSDHNDRHN